MRDVKDARMKRDNFLSIDVRVEGSGSKTIEYEAPDKKTAQQIVAKIRYIKYSILILLWRIYNFSVVRNLERRNH